MRTISLLLFGFFSICGLSAQHSLVKPLIIHIQPHIEERPIILKTESYPLKGEALHIETLRFYLSNITFLKAGSVVWQEAASYHLVDAEEEASLHLSLQIPESTTFDQLEFLLGIDSTTSVSGAMGGDLDPTKGMYWSWNSGYVNFKLEGTSPLCDSRNHEFQYHLGGYLPPFQSAQVVQLQVSRAESLEIGLDIGTLLQQLDLSQQTHIMSPSAKAQQMAAIVATLFHCHE